MQEKRLKKILLTSLVAILTNIGIGAFKAVVGLMSHSIAITMDAVNNFTDAGSSLITMLSSYFATKEADKKHPFGYGRTEYLGTLLIAILILYAGMTALVESIKGIISPQVAEYSTISLVIIIVAVVVKVLLSVYLMKMGKKTESDSLVASGKESIGDVAISLATIVAAFIYLFAHISIEAWVGAVIAIFITKTGAEILLETIGKILGTSGDVELVKNIKKAIASHEGVLGAYDLILHNYGPSTYHASVHIEVEDDLMLSQLDDLSREIHDDILEKFGVMIAAIGIYSVNNKDADIIAIRDEIRNLVKNKEYVNGIHGFYLNKDKKVMRFDLVISFGAKNRREVYNQCLDEIKNKYPDYDITAGMDADFNEL